MIKQVLWVGIGFGMWGFSASVRTCPLKQSGTTSHHDKSWRAQQDVVGLQGESCSRTTWEILPSLWPLLAVYWQSLVFLCPQLHYYVLNLVSSRQPCDFVFIWLSSLQGHVSYENKDWLCSTTASFYLIASLMTHSQMSQSQVQG